ncbi:MAG: hypothetical protein GF331_26790, partial [Chitinivibrionales bacterium]|nr:hypothetical protein [Chitinivibrionales bacterium]
MFHSRIALLLTAVCVLHADSSATPFLQQYASARYVRDILPDGDSLWLATSNGLYHAPIDGGDTVHYSLPADFGDIDLRALVRASDGQLWIGTTGGYVVSMDPATQRFSPHNALGYAGWDIACMSAYKGYLLIGSGFGMSVFSRSRGVVVANAKKFGDRENARVSAIETYGDTIAVLLDNAVAWMAPDDIMEKNLNDPSVWSIIDTQGVQGVLVDRNGFHLYPHRVQRSGGSRFDIAYSGGTTVILRNGLQLATLGGFVNRVVEHKDAIYLGMEGNSLLRLFPDGSNEHIVLNSLPRTDTRDFMIDSRGVLWCVHDYCVAGVSRRIDGVWSSLKHSSPDDPGFGNVSTGRDESPNRILSATNGDVWVATAGVGVKWYDRSSGMWSHFEDSGLAAATGMTHTPSPITRLGPDPVAHAWTFVSALCEDSTGAIWMANERAYNGKVMHVFDPERRRWRSFSIEEHGLPFGYVRGLEASFGGSGQSHYVYAGCAETDGGAGEGLVQFRFSDDPVDGHVAIAREPVTSRAAINDLAIVRDSLVYLATNSGLLRLHNHNVNTITAIELIRPTSPI